MFLNLTESIGLIMTSGTTTVSGSIVATLFMVLAFLIAIGILFNIPLEFMSILILPFCIAVGAYYSSFMIPIICIIIYIAAILAKNFLFR